MTLRKYLISATQFHHNNVYFSFFFLLFLSLSLKINIFKLIWESMVAQTLATVIKRINCWGLSPPQTMLFGGGPDMCRNDFMEEEQDKSFLRRPHPKTSCLFWLEKKWVLKPNSKNGQMPFYNTKPNQTTRTEIRNWILTSVLEVLFSRMTLWFMVFVYMFMESLRLCHRSRLATLDSLTVEALVTQTLIIPVRQ